MNKWLTDIDVESCGWALQVLELSTTPTLVVQIKQLFDILPPNQQDGLTLFKLLVDKLDLKTFENTKLLQDYILPPSLLWQKCCPWLFLFQGSLQDVC
mgnify:CR=1 FL=1